jgi:hypothetical protein
LRGYLGGDKYHCRKHQRVVDPEDEECEAFADSPDKACPRYCDRKEEVKRMITKDCPFCGMCSHEDNGKCNIEIESQQYQKSEYEWGRSYVARCTGCGATGPERYSESDAEDAWNEREK